MSYRILFSLIIALGAPAFVMADDQLDFQVPPASGVFVDGRANGKGAAFELTEAQKARVEAAKGDEVTLKKIADEAVAKGRSVGTFQLASKNTNDLDSESNTSACHNRGWRRGWRFAYRPVCRVNRCARVVRWVRPQVHFHTHFHYHYPVTFFNQSHCHNHCTPQPQCFSGCANSPVYQYDLATMVPVEEGFLGFYH